MVDKPTGAAPFSCPVASSMKIPTVRAAGFRLATSAAMLRSAACVDAGRLKPEPS